MQSAIKKRIAGTMSANLFGQLVTISTQLINVPLFLSVWGEDLYGEWLVVSALPLLIGQSCSGFAAAGGTEMLVRGRDDRDLSLGIFHTSTFITSLIGAAILAVAGLAAALNLGARFGFEQLSARQINTLLVLFAAQMSLHIAMGQVVAGFRAAEMFARGFMWQHMTRVGAFAGGALALLTGRPPVIVAVSMLAGQASLMAISVVALRSRVPWLTWGVARRSRDEFRRLWWPTIANTVDPLALSLRAQAMVIVLGFFATPAAAAAFAALRTLGSILVQLTRIANRAIQQEMSVAFGKGQIRLMQRMHHRLLRYSLWASVAGSAALLTIGRPLFEYWTRGKLAYSAAALALLLASTLLHSLAMVNATVLRAVNGHARYATVFLVSVGVAAAVGIPLSAHWGVVGAAAALLVCDLPVLIYATRQSIVVTQDSSRNLFLALSLRTSQAFPADDRPRQRV